MERVYNFSPGPAALPEELLNEVQAELLNWHGLGASVMEISHRGADFKELMAEAEADLRELLVIPDNYRVLFTAGPGRVHYAMMPLNLLGNKTSSDHIVTGTWSKMAAAEAQRYGDVNIVCDSEPTRFTTIPKSSSWKLNPDAAYVNYCANETIHGVEFQEIPDVGDVPLACDMTSCFLSRPFDVSRYGLVYAGSQKNIAPAGLTLVLIRDDLLNKASKNTPDVLNYSSIAEHNSASYTPPTFLIYMAALMFKWIKKQGGLAALAEINNRKAAKLYQLIDGSDFYQNPVEPNSRSVMNVPFTLSDDSLNERFMTEAREVGLANLKGHRAIGGMRASIYNAMPEAGVDALVSFMQEFEKNIA